VSERGGRSILLVAQLAPPSTVVAARRTGALAKYLARAGHAVTVLTSTASGLGPIDGAAEVIRSADLLTSRLNWRRDSFDAVAGGGGVYRPASRLESLVVPDLAVVGWVPSALPRALRLRPGRFDCVITSSPPQSAHLIGLALRRRGVRWIAEFRDGWTFDPPRRPWPTGVQRRLDAGLERLVARRASALVGVTQPIADDLTARFGGAVAISNGFDPEETFAGDGSSLLDGAKHSLVYTGRMAVAGRSPEPLLAALRLLRAESPETIEHLEVVFAGPLTRAEQLLLRAPDLGGVVRDVGALDRRETQRLQLAADSLLVIAVGVSGRSVATGKLFEYLQAGRPILVLGQETEAARIVEETKTGLVTSAADPRAIADAIRRLIDSGPELSPDPAAVARYSWRELGGRYAQLIESVCGDDGGR
jgi:glycosyltransferase involved in cell wall biosynthesis